MNRLVLSAGARVDLFGIWNFVAAHDEAAADRLVARFQEAFDRLKEFSGLGQRRPDLGSDPIRLWVENPYLIVYREIGDGVEIARVIHGSRDLRSALRSEPG